MSDFEGRCLCGAVRFAVSPPTLFFASSICPGEIHVARPAIPGPIDRTPQCHVFHDQRPDWVELGDSLPRFDTDDPALARFRAAPR